jgi:heme-degrading monooxygenase HmoA
MEIILVHWLIKSDKTEEFVDHWKNNMKVGNAEGFYREILTRPISKPDDKFNTFSVTDKNYDTYINIALWESVEHFDAAIKTFFPKTESQTKTDGKRKIVIELEDFEYKMRERIVLKPLGDRSGQDLPLPTLSE